MAEKKTERYQVKEVTNATTGGGKPYLRLQLFEKGGKTHPAVYWEFRELKAGQVIEALVEPTIYKDTQQLTVHALRVLEGEKASDEFLPKSSRDPKEMFEELSSFVADVQDSDIRSLLVEAIKDPRWKRAPAAKSMHHAFLHGLMEHVLELCKLSHAVAVIYPQLNRDLLVALAILHDIGKLSEYEYSQSIGTTDQGELLGHISIGYQRVTRIMDKIGTPSVDEHGVAEGLRLVIEHGILAHHGQKAFGSPVTPLTIEASVFCKLDGVGADVGRLWAAALKISETAIWADLPGYGKERLYLGYGRTIKDANV
jgi:3'-5' exoribonuclease